MRRIGWGLIASSAWATAVLAATGAAGPAHAADMSVPPTYNPPRAALPPAMYDWTGIYFGGDVGAGLLMDSVGQAPAPAAVTNLTGSTSLGPVGVIGGAQAGLNFEFAPVVIGGEVSWSSSAITGNASVLTTTPGVSERATSNTLWFATATGRAGYAANDWLFYAKGGGAVLNVGYTQDIVTVGVTGPTQSIGSVRKGFTVGGGVEYGMTEDWSAKLEYDFFDFGSQTYDFNQTPVSINSRMSALTFGINYRLNWAGGWH